MKLHRIKPALTAIAALSLTMNLSAQRHGPAASRQRHVHEHVDTVLAIMSPKLQHKGIRMMHH